MEQWYLPAVCGGELNKGMMVSASTSVLEGAAPPVLVLKSDNLVPLLRSLALFQLLSFARALG